MSCAKGGGGLYPADGGAPRALGAGTPLPRADGTRLGGAPLGAAPRGTATWGGGTPPRLLPQDKQGTIVSFVSNGTLFPI